MQQHPGSDPSVPPPFGNSPEFAAMLCRAVADATLPTARATVAAAIASYVSMPFPGNDAEWGRVYVAALRDLRTDLPSSQALVRMCRGIIGNTRCDMMRQALAMLYIEGLHGGENVRRLTPHATPAVPMFLQPSSCSFVDAIRPGMALVQCIIRSNANNLTRHRRGSASDSFHDAMSYPSFLP